MKKTLALMLIVLAGFATAWGQVTTKSVRLSLYAQSITDISTGKPLWTFSTDELIEIDIVSNVQRAGVSTVVVDLRSGDAPGHLMNVNGINQAMMIEGQLRLYYRQGVLERIDNMSVTATVKSVEISNVNTTPSYPVPTVPLIQPPIQSNFLFQGPWAVPVGYGWKPIVLTTAGRVTGRLEGSGGSRGEFEAFIMNDQQLKNYRNGLSVIPLWSSGKVVVADLSVRLTRGTYYLVIKNSGWVSRTVTGTLIQSF